MSNTYGVTVRNGEYRDVSNTARGAKNYATRNEFNTVYVRFNSGYHLEAIAFKVGKVWRATAPDVEENDIASGNQSFQD